MEIFDFFFNEIFFIMKKIVENLDEKIDFNKFIMKKIQEVDFNRKFRFFSNSWMQRKVHLHCWHKHAVKSELIHRPSNHHQAHWTETRNRTHQNPHRPYRKHQNLVHHHRLADRSPSNHTKQMY